jgi:hypothetical protein
MAFTSGVSARHSPIAASTLVAVRCRRRLALTEREIAQMPPASASAAMPAVAFGFLLQLVLSTTA